MKITCLLLCFTLLQTAHGQDFCSLVKKEVSPDKTIFDFSSPYDQANVPPIRVSRNYVLNEDNPSDNFFIIFQITGDLDNIYKKAPDGSQVEKEEQKLRVEFEDKTIFVDDTIKISHDFTNDKTQAIRYVFYPLTEGTLKNFTTKKIAKFSLAGYEQPLQPDSANAVMHYVDCIRAAKK